MGARSRARADAGQSGAQPRRGRRARDTISPGDSDQRRGGARDHAAVRREPPHARSPGHGADGAGAAGVGAGPDRVRRVAVAGLADTTACVGGVMNPLLVCALVVAATWDAWRWYVERIWASPEEAAALTLTIVFLGVLAAVRRPLPPPRSRAAMPLATIAILLAAYAASYAFLPAIMRAALAIAATLFCLHVAVLTGRPPVAFWGLVALALPVLPSLQFTLGYPMRILSVALSVTLAIAGNALRASSLFYLEAGLVADAPSWWHEAIGIVAFVLSAAVTLWLLGRLRGQAAMADAP